MIRRLGATFLAAGLILVALPSAASAVTLSQTTDNSIVNKNSIGCFDFDAGYTSEASYYRVFSLLRTGTTSFTVSSVSFGIEDADDADGNGQPVTINLYALDGAFPGGTLTPIGTKDVLVQDSETLSVHTEPITGTVSDPIHEKLVVEIFVPDGAVNSNIFYIGSNPDGETAPGYIRAPFCDTPDPASIPDIAASSDPPLDVDMDMVLYAEGGQTPPDDPGGGDPGGGDPGGGDPGTGPGPSPTTPIPGAGAGTFTGSAAASDRKCKRRKARHRATAAKHKRCKKRK